MLSDALPLFSYEGARSPAASIDARVKLLLATVAVAGIIIAGHPLQFGTLAVLVVLAAYGARIPPWMLWTNLRPILVFVVVGGVIAAVSTPGHGYVLGPVHVSRAGLDLAARLSAQLILLLIVTTLLTYTTSPFAIANALRRLLAFLQRFRVPIDDMTTMLTIAITFVPIMSREIDRYLTAQAARGANVRRLGLWSMLGDLVVPLIESNLERGEELALALDTRLYGSGKRTYRDEGHLEGASVTAAIGVAAVIIVTAIWL